MYREQLMNGSAMEDHTLCLTFDDGPGPHTLRIAEYLRSQNIQATFFTTGEFASSLPDIPERVQSLGHLIGNHTYDHRDLPSLLAAGGDVSGQITRTDQLIRNWVDGPTVYFRPPYGGWNENVAHALNASEAASSGHVGPIHWDIEGDWWFWQNNPNLLACMARYLEGVGAKGRGIVLFHDYSFDSEVARSANQTFDLVRLLVPVLLDQEFRFLRLDEVQGMVAE